MFAIIGTFLLYFIEFILWYSSNGDVDECDFGVELADKLVDALEKLPQSDFVDKYIEKYSYVL